MLVDSPTWLRHDHADGISAIDISPNGRRLVTCGTDPQVIIWNLLPVLDVAAELNPAVPKQLAVLQEHQGSVQTVKFNHSGTLLASGGNDNVVLLYKLWATPAAPKLGAKSANVENWRTASCLKGHGLDVTSLCWIPGDAVLASSSMDGSVLIWSISTDGQGHLVQTIRGQHNGWVKALAFDPVGRYLATQGRNGVKVWDTQCGWACVSHMKPPFERAPEAGFKFRISWSPDGEHLFTVNGREGGKPTVVTFSRQTWTVNHMVGHGSSVVAAAANPRLFWPPLKLMSTRAREAHGLSAEDDDGQQNEEAAAAAGAGGGAGGGNGAGGGGKSVNGAPAQQQQQQKSGSKVVFGEDPCCIFAAGSNDKTLTVWNSELQIPLLHFAQLHSAPIVDLAWTPDGYTLFAASSDDRITVMRFAECELGRVLTDAQFKTLVDSEYGGAAGALTGALTTQAGQVGPCGATVSSIEAPPGLLSVQDAELAALAKGNAAAMVAAGFPTPIAAGGAAADIAAPAAATAAMAAPAAAVIGSRPEVQKAASTNGSRMAAAMAAAAGAEPPTAAAMSGLERRLMPQGAGITTGTLQQPTAQQQQPGRKRLHPTSLDGAAVTAAAAGNAMLPPSKRLAVAAGGPPVSHMQQPQHPQRQQQLTRAAAAAAAGGGGGVGEWLLSPPRIESKLVCEVARTSVLLHGSLQEESLVLVAENSSSSSGGGCADLSLHYGGITGQVVWRDRLQEQVVSITGTAMFTAAATSSGLLYTWRPGGMPLLPPMALGCPPVSLSEQGGFQVQVVGVDGGLMLLDLEQKTRQLSGPTMQPNLAPILAAAAPGTSLQDAWVCGSSSNAFGSPPAAAASEVRRAHTAVLTDGSAWMFQQDLGLWLMLRPPAAAAAGLGGSSSIAAGAIALTGDAERLRAATAAAAAAAGGGSSGRGLLLPRQPPPLVPLPAEGPARAAWQRREAWLQMTCALLLGDADGYKRWLGILVALLAQQQELTRVKELAQDLLGPECWAPSWPTWPWSPTVLGLDKRALLADLVVPALARQGLHLALQIKNALATAMEYARGAMQSGIGGCTPATATAAATDVPRLRLGPMGPSPAADHGEAGAATGTAADVQQQHWHLRQQLQQQQQANVDHQPQHQHGCVNGVSAMECDGGLAKLAGRTTQMTQQQHQRQQQQQEENQANGTPMQQAPVQQTNSQQHHTPPAVAAAPPAPTPRRLQVLQVQQPQQQQEQQQQQPLQHEKGLGNGAAGRTPLQEHQQPHSLQLMPNKQQEKSQSPAAATASLGN